MRSKSYSQVITELDILLQNGWRASVIFVDDNFIGSKKKLKTDLLPAIIQWMDTEKLFRVFTPVNHIMKGEDIS